MTSSRAQTKTVAVLEIKDDGSLKLLAADGKPISSRKSKKGSHTFTKNLKVTPMNLCSYGITVFESVSSDPCIRVVIENQVYCFILRGGTWQSIPCPCPVS
jgi:hypothetical protein